MFSLKKAFFGERSVTKVAGVFDSDQSARDAVRHVRDEVALDESEVRVLAPSDALADDEEARLARNIEPETRGIWKTLVRAHLIAGGLGVLAGALLFAVLIAIDSRAVVTTPVMSLVAMCGLGLFIGLIAGGALSLRPDHGRVAVAVRQALDNGHWAVVAHPRDARQTHRVVESLEARSERVVRSL